VNAPGPFDADLRWIGRLLGPLVPAACREPLLGDLAEEAALRLGKGDRRTARRWLWGQALRSTPPLLYNLLTREVVMNRNRMLGLAICLPMGLLQAWDAGVLAAGLLVMGLVAAAIAVPALALVVTASLGAYAVAEGITLALLLAARAVSPVPLPTLTVVGLTTALALYVGTRPAPPTLRPRV
jgi:hypothetical protein